MPKDPEINLDVDFLKVDLEIKKFTIDTCKLLIELEPKLKEFLLPSMVNTIRDYREYDPIITDDDVEIITTGEKKVVKTIKKQKSDFVISDDDEE